MAGGACKCGVGSLGHRRKFGSESQRRGCSALRTYAQQQTRSFSVGDIVLMCDDQKKRQDLKLARVSEVFKEKDGKG